MPSCPLVSSPVSASCPPPRLALLLLPAWLQIKMFLLPAEVGGIRQCLRFAANADFHPLMYLEGLAAAVERHGGKIYEGTKAWKAGERALRCALCTLWWWCALWWWWCWCLCVCVCVWAGGGPLGMWWR